MLVGGWLGDLYLYMLGDLYQLYLHPIRSMYEDNLTIETVGRILAYFC